MSFVKSKHFNIIFIILLLFFSTNCQIREPIKTHGINFLENREKLLIINKTNKNDVIKTIGRPHSTSLKDENKWIYFERSITRGKMHKLGQNVLKENNILELEFNKYGVLIKKNLLSKSDMKNVKYSEKETSNQVTQQSGVTKFLQSVKQKMYGKRKF
ncbi:MAG: hypothetical protein CBE47_04150 [Pelagibacteraceae bacterium TMED287]|nr:MAG: hypothetical protein CBE47_04150 [Pelagibacteraceae bacterium TMED287]|tara:strand:- start:444 stop:917 length:474 start_codon:yes stop_codon:yes gene_type:complete